MRLYVNGQDIERFVLGHALEGDWTLKEFEVGPEGYLKTIDAYLADLDTSLDDVKEILVVQGPGSATALRSSLTIVNTIRFAKDVKLFPLEKDPKQDDLEALQRPVKEAIGYVFPVYAHGPRITASKKDRLGRTK